MDEMDPANPAVITLRAQLFQDTIQSCMESPETWQCDLYEGDQRKIGRPTPFEIWEPLVHTGTTSYQDNKECLIAIDDKVMTENLGNLATIVVGDQQTFDRMVKLRRNMPFTYKHIIPFNGEMHFAVHFLHAAWRLYYGPCLQFFAERLKMEYLKEDWTPKNWSYYDDFVMILVTAIVRWLASLPGLNHTEGIDALLEESSQNADTQMLLHFLYDVGLPYVGLRRLLRRQSSREMREESLLYYNMGMHLCRPAQVNKFHYAILCVHATWFYRNTIPSLRNVWDLMSTVSLRGIPGRNIPIDHLCEKVNKASKMMLRGIITEKRLRELIPSLNVLMPAEAEYMNMTGAHDEDRKCFSGKSNRLATAMEVQSDIAGIVGGTWEQCCQPRDRSTFLFGHQGPQAAYPWQVVTDSQLGWRYHVMEKAYEIERYDGRFL